MTGTMGITTVPLPAFWSTSKNEGDQLRRPHPKEHLCQNPRCAANNLACSTPHKEPPPKRIKRPFKNTRPNNLYPVSSNGTPTELESCGGIKVHGRKCADWKVALPPRTTAKLLGESFSGNSHKGSTRINSKESSQESTTPSSHAPSISTPIKSPPKPSKIGLVPLSGQKESSSTRSYSSGCSRGTTQSLLTCRLSESLTDRFIADEDLPPSCLGGGRMAPPNSERDEEEETPMDELHEHKPMSTLPLFNELPAESSSTPCWPPTSLTDTDPIARPTNVAPNTISTSPDLPPKPSTCVPPPVPPEATMTGIWVPPMHCPSPPTAHTSSEGHPDPGFRHGTPISQHFKCRRTPPFPQSRESDASARSSTMGNAAQMCILEQRLEDEDRKSNSSYLTTLGSDSPKESWSTELSGTCGAQPISAFYNALYAPDCTLSGTKALEAHLQRQRRSTDGRLRVALEIAMFSAMVTMLVVVFYPAIIRGLRSHFYDCCSCPAPSVSAESRNPSQHGETHPPVKSSDRCVYRGVRNLLNCPSAQQTIGSTVVK